MDWWMALSDRAQWGYSGLVVVVVGVYKVTADWWATGRDTWEPEERAKSKMGGGFFRADV